MALQVKQFTEGEGSYIIKAINLKGIRLPESCLLQSTIVCAFQVDCYCSFFVCFFFPSKVVTLKV